LAILAAFIGMGYLTFVDDPHVPEGIDSSGYISHKVESTITAQSGWMVGESKSCMSIPLDAQIARAVGKAPGYALFYVKCDDGPERKIQVTFWGAENQPENRVAYWQCKRTTESFGCKQTGADPGTE
ncbi:MAG: hypothetical protein KGL37_06605, partial [Acidobacteriota bacterium]|nr:hypothetical protein [Acidobacteriota bacterium]